MQNPAAHCIRILFHRSDLKRLVNLNLNMSENNSCCQELAFIDFLNQRWTNSLAIGPL